MTDIARQMKAESSYKVIYFRGPELPEQYKGLVITRWTRSLKYGNDYFKLCEPKAYWAVYPKLVNFTLSRPETIVTIAVLSDDEDVALGFSVHEQDVLHYVHVDAVHRRQGIGKTLVSVSTLNTVTHVTKLGIPFWSAVLPRATFNPFRS
jgi:GNAT superfamily N-acetyltransferase